MAMLAMQRTTRLVGSVPPGMAAYLGAGSLLLGSALVGWEASRRPSLAVAAMLAPLLIVLLRSHPEWLLYGGLAMAILPWKVSVPGSGLTIDPAALIAPLLLASTLTRALITRSPIQFGRYGVYGFVILGLAVLSLPKTANPKWSSIDVEVLALTPLCYYLALLNEPRARLATAVKVLMVAVSVVCLSAIAGITILPELAAVTFQADGTAGALRAASVYANPNGLAMAINLVWPLAAAAALDAKGWRRLAWGAATLLLLATLLLTFSRGGWVGALVALGVFVLAARKRFRVATLALAVLMAALVFTVPALNGRLALGLSGTDPSYLTRSELWQTALLMASQHPLLGVGFGPYNYANYLDPRLFTDLRVASTHNVYLDFLLFTGAIGLACYVLLLLHAVFTAVHRWKLASKRRDMVSIAVLAVLAAWIVHGFVDVTYWSLFRVVAFWTVLVLLERSRTGGVQTNPASEGTV